MKRLLFSVSCIAFFSCKNDIPVKTKTPKADSIAVPIVKTGQAKVLNETESKFQAIGDLNKDGLADSAIVTQDTLADTRPYNLKLFFKNAEGSYTQVLSTDAAIDAQFPQGKDHGDNGSSFFSVTISKGILALEEELLRGSYVHKFRYQNGGFELIGFSAEISNGGGIMTSVDYNLSTGRYRSTHQSYETDKIVSSLDTVVRIKPLPSLAQFKPYSYHIGPIDF